MPCRSTNSEIERAAGQTRVRHFFRSRSGFGPILHGDPDGVRAGRQIPRDREAEVHEIVLPRRPAIVVLRFIVPHEEGLFAIALVVELQFAFEDGFIATGGLTTGEVANLDVDMHFLAGLEAGIFQRTILAKVLDATAKAQLVESQLCPAAGRGSRREPVHQGHEIERRRLLDAAALLQLGHASQQHEQPRLAWWDRNASNARDFLLRTALQQGSKHLHGNGVRLRRRSRMDLHLVCGRIGR